MRRFRLFWRQYAGWRLFSEGALVCEMGPVYRAVNSGPVFGDHCMYIRVYFGPQYRHTLTHSLQPLPSLYTYVPRLWCSIPRSPPTPPPPPKHSHTPPCRLNNIYTVCICIYCISFLRRSCSSLLIAQCTVYPAPSERGSLYMETMVWGDLCQ